MYRLWLDHVVLEEAPIPITRRYEASFAMHANIASPVSVTATARRSALIDSDNEPDSSEEGSFSGSTDSEAPKMPLKKSRTTAGVVRASTSPSTAKTSKTAKSRASVSPKRSNSATTPNGTSERPKRTKRSSLGAMTADSDEEDHAPPKKVPKREGTLSRPTRKEPETSPKTKQTAATTTPQRKATPSSSIKQDHTTGSDAPATPKTPRTPKPKRADPAFPSVRVYLSQASEEEKTQYRLRLAATVAFETNIEKATHVVSLQVRTSQDNPVSFAVLYAIATGKFVVAKSWLEDLVGITHIKSIPNAYEHRILDLPGTWKVNELHATRDQYLTENEVDKSSEVDDDIPPLLFSQWTFNLNYLKKSFSQTVINQVREMILANGGLCGGESASDIWLTPDSFHRVKSISYGEPGLPPLADSQLMQEHPHWRKRKFKAWASIAAFPIYAIPFDFLRDSLVSGVCADPSHYPNLLDDLHGLGA